MGKAISIISGVAAGLVSLVKLVGLATGNQWLGDNWQAGFGYVTVLFLVGIAVASLLFGSAPLLPRGRVRDVLQPEGLEPWDWEARLYVAMCGVIALAAAFWAYVFARSPSSWWLLGAFQLAATLLAGALLAATAWLDHRHSRQPCPHCLETIKRAASVCRHCGRDVVSGSPDDEQPDDGVVWV